MGNCYEAQTVEEKWKSERKENSRVFIPGYFYRERNNSGNWKGENGGDATYRTEGNSDGSGDRRVSLKEKMKEPAAESVTTGKILIIAKKPSVGRAISQVLAKGEKGDTFQHGKEGYI